MKRSTISHHRLTSEDSHLDIFFEVFENLETYEAPYNVLEKLLESEKIFCTKKKPHRKEYLDYEGEISNARGCIKVLWKGYYLNEKDSFPDKIKIQFKGSQFLKLEL